MLKPRLIAAVVLLSSAIACDPPHEAASGADTDAAQSDEASVEEEASVNSETCLDAVTRLADVYTFCGEDMEVEPSDYEDCLEDEATYYTCFADCAEASSCDVLMYTGEPDDPTFIEAMEEYASCISACE